LTDRHSAPLDVPGSRTVLIVEDTGVVRRSALRMLTELGYRVFEAASADEALTVLGARDGLVDLLLVDVMMAGKTGVDLVRAVHEQWSTMRVVYMSGYPAQILVEQGLADPRVHFLAKPFTRDELASKVREALKGNGRAEDIGSQPKRGA
jgi:CheY-like chemotaxis protein